MKWSSVLLVTLLGLLAAVGVINCGQGDHGPGSDGMADTGSRLLVTAAAPYDGTKQTMDISMYPGTADDPQFDAAFSTTLRNAPPYTGGVATTGITVESYQVECFSSAPGSVPIPPMKDIGVDSYLLPNANANFTGLVLMSAGAKAQWISDGGDASLAPPYRCKITFFGINDYGYRVSDAANVGVVLGNYARK
jgi:hypothetical protein